MLDTSPASQPRHAETKAPKRTIELLHEHARRDPHGTCVRLFSKRKKEGALTWAEVRDGAGRAASFFKAKGVERGDVVALMGGHDLDFYLVWLGAVWYGAVPCVLPEPSVRVDRAIYWSRLEMMLQFAGVKLLAVGSGVGEVGSSWTNQIPHFTYADVAAGEGPVPEPLRAAAEDPLLLQHSAGTTGQPKSILLTHGMIEHQFANMFRRTGDHDGHVFASWLPLYHDLGMIGSFLGPLHRGCPVIWLSPFEWVSSPTLLLEAITKYRVTDAMFPNFTFAFLANAEHGPNDKFDLSSMKTVYSGGEPVSEGAVQAFLDRYEPLGFPKSAFHVGYGMAESVAIIVASGPECHPKFVSVDKERWLQEHHAVPSDPAKVECVTHVSCGRPLTNIEIRVVDEEGRPVAARCAGRVLVKTPYLFSGYYRRDDLNHDLFDAEGFYDSGDLGYVDEDGHVYVTGRKKDLVIVGGRNVYPQDVEDVANKVPGVHPGRVVCFGVTVGKLGTEGIVVLFESDEPEGAWAGLTDGVRRAITHALDVSVYDTRCVTRMTLRKSTAGKLARGGNRTWYLEGRFGDVHADVLKS